MNDYSTIFAKNLIYTENEINKIVDKYGIFVTDCIKDDNEITVSLHEDGEPSWEFELFNEIGSYPLKFRLRWTIYDEVVKN